MTGCTHYYKLDVKSVTALEVSGDAKSQICARGALVDVRAVTKDGQQHSEGDSEHPKDSQFDPSAVKLEASIGSFHDHSWNPPDDPRSLLSTDEITITATLIGNPKITATTKMAPTWACDPPVAYAGGNDGAQGGGGTQDGDAGGPGGHGGNGQNVVVAIGWIEHRGGRLALANVQSDAGDSIYVLDPTTPLKVVAGGGAGGGGTSGAFGKGMDRCEGRGGPGGRGGDGGEGGDGGTITIHYDAASPELGQMVVADAHGGDAGPPGSGGPGGAGPNGCDSGEPGKDGAEGRRGRDGRVSTLAVTGLGEQLAELAHGGVWPSATTASASASPALATTDGARYYSGRADITSTVLHRQPDRKHMMVRVESTRTRRRHFTITFGDCKLEFHRPEGEQQHRYALDAASTCESPGGPVEIRDAILELDAATDTLGLTWDGVADARSRPVPTRIAFTFTGRRR